MVVSVSQGVCSSDIEEGVGLVVSVSQGVCSSGIEEGGGSGRLCLTGGMFVWHRGGWGDWSSLSHRGYVRLT